MNSTIEQLNPGEVVCFRGRVSTAYIVVLCIIAVLFCWTFIIPVLVIIKLLRIGMTQYFITNKRIVIKTGVISKTVSDIALSKCEGVEFYQGLFGRLFGWGTMVTTGTGMKQQRFKGLADPIQFRNELFRIIEENSK